MSGGKTALGLDLNIGALLCYLGNLACGLPLGLVYSILVVAQDKNNRVVRFHAFQSIFLSVAGAIIGIPLGIVYGVSFFIDAALGLPIVTGLLSLVLLVLSIAVIYFVVMAAIKAYNGEIYKIPVIGNFAEKYSN